MDETTVTTDGDIDACLFEVLVTSMRYIDDRRSLSTTNTLLLTGDTDRSTTDTDLDEVGTSFGEIAEALFVDDITCPDEDVIAIVLTDPAKGVVLPFGVAIRGVDAEDIGTSLDECRDTLGVVTGIDTSSDE